MGYQAAGSLIAAGGREDRDGQRTILRLVARDACDTGGALVIIPTAAAYPTQLGDTYRAIFQKLGVPRVEVVGLLLRADASTFDLALDEAAG